MTSNGKEEFHFYCVTFKELEAFEKKQPIVYKELSKFWKILRTCPDINSDFPCFFYITNGNDQIVSSGRAYPDTLWAKGKKYSWAWTGDLYTDNTNRGKGLASMIFQGEQKSLHERGIAWGGVSANAINLHICKKLRFSFPGYGRRYVMLKTARPLLEAKINIKVAIRILDLLSRPVIRLIFQYCFGMVKGSVVNLKTVKVELSEENDVHNLLPAISYQTRYHFDDNPERLFWKIKGSNAKSENNTSLYILMDGDTGEALCYFVIRLKHQIEPLAEKYNNFKRMTLMDYGLFKDDERIYSGLIKEIMSFFWKSDAEVLDIISSSPIFGSILKHRGMIKVGKGESFAFSLPEDWALDSDGANMKEWHFTNFTGDCFTF